ncbi:MAG TPA: hypothetical protein VK971_03655 [Thiohalobacter sp.]|nr:hypothetical protein [Thiohalobacter sp.]
MNDSYLQELNHPLNDYRIREERFLAAWKRGIHLIGPQLFLVRAASVEAATDKNELRPDSELIEDSIHVISRGQAAFLGAMCSFFNPDWGQKLLSEIGFPNLCDIAAKLDREHAEVIAELFLTYSGW